MDRTRLRAAMLTVVAIGVAVLIVVAVRRGAGDLGSTSAPLTTVEEPGGDAFLPEPPFGGGSLRGRGGPASPVPQAPTTVPLVEGVDQIAFDVDVAVPEGVRREGFRVVVELVPLGEPVVRLGEAITDSKGRCRIGPITTPQVTRSSVAGAAVDRHVYGPYANRVGGSGPPIFVRASGRDDVRVAEVVVLAGDFAVGVTTHPADMPPGHAADVDGVRVMTIGLRALNEVLLRGRVVDAAGRPLAGVRVTIPAQTSFWVATTDREGRFEGTVDRADRVAIAVVFAWFDRHSPPALRREIELVPGSAATTVELVVESEPSIEGRVVDPDGRPLAGVPLALLKTGETVADAISAMWSSSDSQAPAYQIRTRSMEDGSFRFFGLPKGNRFDVRWWDDERQERAGPADLAPEAKEVIVRVSSRHGVRVRCVDAGTGASIAAAVHIESVSLPLSEEDSWRLTDPDEDGFRGKPGETLRIVAQADRYDTRVLEHVVGAEAGLEVVVVRLSPARSRARVIVRSIDEAGGPWVVMPDLKWTYEGTAFEVRPRRMSPAGIPTTAAGEFETRDLAPGRYRLRSAYDACGLPASGTLRFAVPGERIVEVPDSGDVAAPLTLERGGGLRIAIHGKNGSPLSPGDMTSLSARGADGKTIELRIFAKDSRRGGNPTALSEGVHGAVAHETQALPPGIYTVEWTGGLHRGSPPSVSVTAHVRAGEVVDVEIVDPR